MIYPGKEKKEHHLMIYQGMTKKEKKLKILKVFKCK